MSTSTPFIESCVDTAADNAAQVARTFHGKHRARRLIKSLRDKKNVLITTHQHPDPDALASALGLRQLLRGKLPGVPISMSIKGEIAGGINDAFRRHTRLDLTPWDDAALGSYDAVILLDCQPNFAYSPLPPGITPFAVIDHHRAPGRKPNCPFSDIRTGVGATSSIIFSYFMEMETPINAELAATLLYAIETDLAGAAGLPTSLDNLALSSLTLVADTNTLYQMRHVDLPQFYYDAYFLGLANASYVGNVIFSHIGTVQSLEQPAVIADFLMRFDQVQWALVTAVHGQKLILSLRTSDGKRSAGKIARRLIRKLGAGGGHRSKAGGYLNFQDPSGLPALRKTLRRRLLRALGVKSTPPLPLVDRTRLEPAENRSTGAPTRKKVRA